MQSITAIQFFSMLLAAAPLGISAYQVPVKAVDKVVIQDENTITYREPGRPGRITWACERSDDEYLAISADRAFATCCNAPNSVLVGSAATEFHCCNAGEDLATSAAEGAYDCCPKDRIFGDRCVELCKNGMELDTEGNCVCPKGQEVLPDGTCGTRKPDEDKDDKKETCESGLETGKCYQFKGRETGRLLAFSNGQYSEATAGKNVIPGKFQFCLDEPCRAGQPVNPSNRVHIRDLHGSATSAAGQWLNAALNGAHISKTPDFARAGHFSISKWICGSYCLTGFLHGVAIACPAHDPSISFYTKGDSEACVPFELIEVPCDIRDDANNCLWDKAPKKC